MAELNSIDLRGKISDIGAVRFLRVEWKNPQSRFVLIRYAVDGKEEPYGLRLDLDKKAILDDVGDEATAAAVKSRAQDIWKIVVEFVERERIPQSLNDGRLNLVKSSMGLGLEALRGVAGISTIRYGRRSINEAGLNLIASFEGCLLAAHQDVAGIWTIGYGHIRGVRQGMTITQEQAVQFLQHDLTDTETSVDSMTSSISTTNNQFAAMVSLCFSIGTGKFRTSSVLRFHLARDCTSAADAFLLWDKGHVNGQLVKVQGLLNRRKAERDLYLTQEAS